MLGSGVMDHEGRGWNSGECVRVKIVSLQRLGVSVAGGYVKVCGVRLCRQEVPVG